MSPPVRVLGPTKEQGSYHNTYKEEEGSQGTSLIGFVLGSLERGMITPLEAFTKARVVCGACAWEACCLFKKKQVFGASRTVVPLPLVLRKGKGPAFRSLH